MFHSKECLKCGILRAEIRVVRNKVKMVLRARQSVKGDERYDYSTVLALFHVVFFHFYSFFVFSVFGVDESGDGTKKGVGKKRTGDL